MLSSRNLNTRTSNYSPQHRSIALLIFVATINHRNPKMRFVPAPKEDYVFWLLILKQSIVAYNTNTTLALYRDSLASRSSDKVAMLKNQWKIVRHLERVNFFYSLYCMAIYSLKGLRKYIR